MIEFNWKRTYIYICVYVERQRERQRESEKERVCEKIHKSKINCRHPYTSTAELFHFLLLVHWTKKKFNWFFFGVQLPNTSYFPSLPQATQYHQVTQYLCFSFQLVALWVYHKLNLLLKYRKNTIFSAILHSRTNWSQLYLYIDRIASFKQCPSKSIEKSE